MPTNEYTFDHAAQIVPDIAAAISWYQENIPGVTVLHSDATWGFITANGAKIAFVTQDQHPGHIGFRVSTGELQMLAARHSKEIKPHRDGTHSFYVSAPGNNGIEFISYEGSEYEEMNDPDDLPRD